MFKNAEKEQRKMLKSQLSPKNAKMGTFRANTPNLMEADIDEPKIVNFIKHQRQ
jgi:hypothetical protein